MTRGRRAAGVATAAKKTSRRLPAVTSPSIAAALRQASAPDDANTVFQRSTVNSGKLVANPRIPATTLRLQPTAPDVSFWKGFCRPAVLAQTLANIGTLIEADSILLFTTPRLRYPFSALSFNRLQTAMQAVIDAAALLQSGDDDGGGGEQGKDDWPSCSAGVRKREIIEKLIQLAETAVPMKWSIISCFAGSSDTFITTLCALRDRMQQLRRLWQLWECHMHAMPLLRLCNTRREVATVIFGSSTGTADTVDAMQGMSSWHQREQHVIRVLMERANDNDPCVESWGPSFAPPLRVVGGSYILHRSSRSEALACLLDTAEFFGLPPFLRSVRVAGGQTRLCLTQPFPTSRAANSLAHSSDEPLPSLFPSPYDLDPRRYESPGPSQAQVVQEELIDLVSQHCCFGMLIGEADQVLGLLRASAGCMQHAEAKRESKQRSTATLETIVTGTGGTKIEQPNANVSPAVKDNARGDPLLPYAQSLLRTGRGGNGNGEGVYWLCGNRWNSMMNYYALVIAVVLPHDCSDGEHGELYDGLVQAAVPYYVAAVLELTRS